MSLTTGDTCSAWSGGSEGGRIGKGMGTLQINGVTAATGGRATVKLVYVNGDSSRVAHLSVNGAPAVSLTFPGTGGWSTPGTLVLTMNLKAGGNTLKFFNTDAAAPDFDKI